MAGIPTSNILQPGNVSITGGANRALVSQLQLLKPHYYREFVEKYGEENWTWWLMTYGGMELVKGRDYFWFENRGKLMTAVGVASNVAANTNGATVTFQLALADHYNSGTQTPLRVGETVRVASTNVEGEIIAITDTTPNAFHFQVRPKKTTQNLASRGSTDFLTSDYLIFGGDMDAGEASGSIEPLIALDQKYENSTTEMRETWKATDRAEMEEVFYDSGVSGSVPNGGQQAGTSMFTYKGLVKSNTRYVNYTEFKLMRGDTVDNTGLNGSNSVGSQGVIPKVLADGETYGYTPGTLGIQQLHDITRIMDVNGCAKQNQWLMDIFQKQDFSDTLFAQFPAGSFVWGQGEKSEEASVAYGFKNIYIDGYLFQTAKYKQFNTEVTTGKTPDVDYFRNFGLIVPQGSTRDARDATKVYKNLTIMYQEPPAGGTIGNGIRVWQHGGGSRNPTDGTMRDNVEMIAYKGTRICAANQFLIVQSL
jgi:hypothetical protein